MNNKIYVKLHSSNSISSWFAPESLPLTLLYRGSHSTIENCPDSQWKGRKSNDVPALCTGRCGRGDQRAEEGQRGAGEVVEVSRALWRDWINKGTNKRLVRICCCGEWPSVDLSEGKRSPDKIWRECVFRDLLCRSHEKTDLVFIISTIINNVFIKSIIIRD